MQGVFTNLTGQRFGRLTVVSCTKREGKVGLFWECICDCGKIPKKAIGTSSLLRGLTQSCGCLNIQKIKEANTTHKQTKTPTYISWKSMWQRCTDPNHKSYLSYKDFTPYDRWKTFENFVADMGERPENTTLDRIDNTKGYFLENCRWASAFTQQANTKQTIYVLLNEETVCLKEACRRTGMPYSRAKNRVRNGWSPYDAATLSKTNKWENMHQT